MNERRRKTRTDLEAHLVINRLDGSKIQAVNIEVTNVSTTGIGFMCDEVLEIGSLYEGTLIIWTKEKLQVCMDIVRSREVNGRYNYGALFVGMPELYSRKISVYQTVEETKNKMEILAKNRDGEEVELIIHNEEIIFVKSDEEVAIVNSEGEKILANPDEEGMGVADSGTEEMPAVNSDEDVSSVSSYEENEV